MALAVWQRMQRASAQLSRDSVRAMEGLPWFCALPPEQRSYAGVVVQAGLSAFVHWLRTPEEPVAVSPDVFSVAPAEMTRAIDLKQTVELIRVAVGVVEAAVPSLAPPGKEAALREAVLRYSREIAFAAAMTYARAAEARGSWDARIEAGVVDALVRGEVTEVTLSRAASVGWVRVEWAVAVAMRTPDAAGEFDLAPVRSAVKQWVTCLLARETADGVVLVLGGNGSRARAQEAMMAALPPGPVVIAPHVAELEQVPAVLQEAMAGLAALPAWPGAPRPVTSGALLAERTVLGDPQARARLVEEVYTPLAAAGGDLLLTVTTYLDCGGSLEAASRALFLHANSVRYRLRKVHEVLGLDLTNARDAHLVRIAIIVGTVVAR